MPKIFAHKDLLHLLTEGFREGIGAEGGRTLMGII